MSYQIKPEDVPEQFTEMVEEKFISYYDGPLADVAAILKAAIEAGLVARRIPDADDPRVLRRAIELCVRFIWTVDEEFETNPESWIDQASRELESEDAEKLPE